MRRILLGLLAAITLSAPALAVTINKPIAAPPTWTTDDLLCGGSDVQHPVDCQAKLGASVGNPGTGTIEARIQVQATVGASHTFVQGDMFKKLRRSNSGSAMTDTLPSGVTLTNPWMTNGSMIIINNADPTAHDTISAGAATTIFGSSSYVLDPGREIWLTYDASTSDWRPVANTATTAVFPPGTMGTYTPGDVVVINSANGQVADGGPPGSGSGNANFGTTSGNTTNDPVCMQNTTVGIKDCGYAPSATSPVVYSSGDYSCPACVTSTGGGPITASAPLSASLGGNISIAGVSGTQGNGGLLQRSTGSTTTNHAAQFDANGNTVDSGVFSGVTETTITSNTTASLAFNVYRCNAAGGSVTLTIPQGSTLTSSVPVPAFSFKKVDTSANPCILAFSSGDTFQSYTAMNMYDPYTEISFDYEGSATWDTN